MTRALRPSSNDADPRWSERAAARRRARPPMANTRTPRRARRRSARVAVRSARRESLGKYTIASLATSSYPRDLVGYGAKPPKAKWPGGARIALQFVLNYEEGGENSILHGDKAAEAFLSEIVGAQPLEGVRHMSMESLYEYGSPAGLWRVLELFRRYDVPLSIFGLPMALARDPSGDQAFTASGPWIAC